MKIECLILADAVQAVAGKLFILGGGWNLYRAANYPVNIQLALAIDLSFSRNEAGAKYPLTLVVADDAGVPIVPQINGVIDVVPPADELPKGALIKLPLAFNTVLQIPRIGRYVIVVTAGSSKAQTSFDAIFTGDKVDLSSGSTGDLERGN
jgi:hypothetical protein